LIGPTNVLPFALIAVPPEGEQLAGFVERYARAICERVLPSLSLTFEERQELTRQDLEIHEQINRDAWKYELGTEGYGEYANPGDSFGTGFEVTNYAEMEAQVLQMHVLGLAFAGLFHIFERQVVMILHRLDHRRNRTVLRLVSEKERHNFAGYKKLLEIGGTPISGAIGTDIERLRLIANVMKHGSAHAIRTLHKAFPDLFWLGSHTISIDSMLLTPDLLMSSAGSIARFWRAFPTHD